MGCLKLHIDQEPTLSLAYRKKAQKLLKNTLSYYPFGLQQKGYNNFVTGNKNSIAERFMFGGKEYGEELGLNWYDFSARNYDVALGRWMNVDMLADATGQIHNSPYVYAMNNPIVFTDPDGKCPPGVNCSAIWAAVKSVTINAAEGLSRVLNGGAPSNVPVGSPANYSRETSSGPSKNITGNYFGDAAYKLAGGETISRALDGDHKAQGQVIMNGLVGLTPGGRANPSDELSGSVSKLFRVQGGDAPNASKQRFIFDNDGNISGIDGNDMLFITLDDEARAIQFLQKRGENAELISFEINGAFSDKIRGDAVPQRLGRLNPGSPQQVDETVTSDSFGVPSEYFEELINSINQISVRRVGGN